MKKTQTKIFICPAYGMGNEKITPTPFDVKIEQMIKDGTIRILNHKVHGIDINEMS